MQIQPVILAKAIGDFNTCEYLGWCDRLFEVSQAVGWAVCGLKAHKNKAQGFSPVEMDSAGYAT